PYLPNQGICFNKALRTPDNEIVAVGKASQNYDVSSACFFRFSSAGDTLATAFWPVDQGSQYLEAGAYDLALMDNGNILVTCYLSSILGSVLEIDINGDILNRVDILGIFWSIDSSLTINRSLDNESFILAGTTGPHPDYSIKVFLLFAGELTFLFEVDNSILTWVSSVKLQTDSMYLCGRVFEGGLINVSYSGDVNWVWNHQGGNSTPYIWDGFGSPSTALLDLDSDGCIYWAWGNSGNQVVIKLLPNGQLPIEDELISPPVNRISAYPNPMKDHLNIKITQDDGTVTGENRIEIYNIKGQLVRSIEVSKGETEWDGKDKQGKHCPLGIYLLRFNESLTTKICKSY
ncbi:MAG: T9SS type A sorting domain-containing protein, partial [Candidatus Cloacimonadaceae bacterium]